MDRTRAEHLAWCKERALEYLDMGDMNSAVASMGSDLQKHPDTKQPTALLVMGMFATGEGPDAVRRWIQGFN